MWDLVKGRCTYTSKLEAEAEAVAFCAEDGGERYALLCGSRVTLHSVQGGEGARIAVCVRARVSEWSMVVVVVSVFVYECSCEF